MTAQDIDALMQAHANAVEARESAEALEDLYLRRVREAQAALEGRR